MDFWQIILTPFSWVLKMFCQLFDSYGIALICFTIVVKIILFPLSLKGKKSMIKMNIASVQLKEIQKRCGNDKERYNQEVQQFYEDNNISAFGGCGWSMIPLLILMPLYAIIRRPLKYLMRLTDANTIAVAGALGLPDFTISGYSELTLAAQMNAGNLSAAKAAAGSAAAGMFLINFEFLGLNLASIPNWKFWTDGVTWNSVGLFLLPLISAALSLLSMVVSQKTNRMNNKEEGKEDPAAKSNRTMMLVSPIISLWIGFSMPAGLCVYWIANSLLMMFQEWLCGVILRKDYQAAQKEIEEQQRKAKEAEKQRRREAAERKAAAIAANKGKVKKGQVQTKDKDREKGMDLTASRSGMRAYARGRAYDPNRYPVTPYHDPNKPYQPPVETGPLTEEEKQILTEAGVEIPKEAPAETAAEAAAAIPETAAAPQGEEAPVAETAAEEAAGPAEEDFEAAYADESEDEEPNA